MGDLPLKCDCGCKEIEHRDIRTDDIDGISVVMYSCLLCKADSEHLLNRGVQNHFSLHKILSH